MVPLPRDYYLQDTLHVAEDLIGKYLVRNTIRGQIVTRINETEAYAGVNDRACHGYGGRKTPRNSVLYNAGGLAYVFFIYGMYYCVNAVTENENNPCAVLIRGGEVVLGIEAAAFLRYGEGFENLSRAKVKNMSNGPGKLCMTMEIGRELNGIPLDGREIFITDSIPGVENKTLRLQRGPRIGIDYAGEAAAYLWRFYGE